MNHHLQIHLKPTDGAVLRALGTIERRGFKLESMHVAEVKDGRQAMDIQVSSERNPQLLKRQLERLHDVVQVEVKQQASQWTEQAEVRSMSGS